MKFRLITLLVIPILLSCAQMPSTMDEVDAWQAKLDDYSARMDAVQELMKLLYDEPITPEIQAQIDLCQEQAKEISEQIELIQQIIEILVEPNAPDQ